MSAAEAVTFKSADPLWVRACKTETQTSAVFLDSKSTASAADPALNPVFSFWKSHFLAKSQFLTDFLPIKKSLKNHQIPQATKSAQKLKNLIPGRPKGQILSIFHDFWVTKNHENWDWPKPHILKEVSSETLVCTLPALSFSNKFSSKIHVFSRTAPVLRFFSFFPKFYRKNGILAPPLDPLGLQRATKIGLIPENNEKNLIMRSLFGAQMIRAFF